MASEYKAVLLDKKGSIEAAAYNDGFYLAYDFYKKYGAPKHLEPLEAMESAIKSLTTSPDTYLTEVGTDPLINLVNYGFCDAWEELTGKRIIR